MWWNVKHENKQALSHEFGPAGGGMQLVRFASALRAECLLQLHAGRVRDA